MLRYRLADLSDSAMKSLGDIQGKVDAVTDARARYEKATSLFGSKSPRNVFKEIRDRLSESSPPGGACYYCERDRYRDIEHVKPKRHYPEVCFHWGNYVYACTICNQDRKKDTYAVMDDSGQVIKFDRSWPIDRGIPVGIPMLIDIRHEDPLDFLKLDLMTGLFVVKGDGDIAEKKGEFTRDLFNLNDDSLSRIRRQAFSSFKNYMKMYEGAFNRGNGDAMKRIKSEILELPFPTVLVEMRRQSNDYDELRALFKILPSDVGARP